MIKVLAFVIYILDFIFTPIWRELKMIFHNLFYSSKRSYSYYNGGLTIFPLKSKKQVDELYAIYEVPDDSIITEYYRRIHRLNRFTISFGFDDYCGCNKYELIKFKATIRDYKNKYITNLKYKTNYEINRTNFENHLS